MGTKPALAKPAPTLTMLASAMPTSMERSGKVFWNGLIPVEPWTSELMENTG